ncbi:MAG: glycosyltransferase [Ignavibacteria bacterium]|nr:glycosyltransferase [Ignavibacteria bacterium]
MVSVIIPTYNRAGYLKEALISILSQTYNDLEIIVIDDDSNDNTSEIVLKLNSEKIFYFKQNKIGIIGKLRNIGIQKSKYDIIAFCDDDDIWEPEKLEKQMKYIDKYDLICSNAKVINSNGEQIENKKLILNEKSKELDLYSLLLGNIVITSTVILKKDKLYKTGLFDEDEKYYCSEDYDLWLRYAADNKVFYMNDDLILYREHLSNSNNYHHRQKMLKNVLAILDSYSYKNDRKMYDYVNAGKLSVKISLMKLFLMNNRIFKFLNELFSVIFNIRYITPIIDALRNKLLLNK